MKEPLRCSPRESGMPGPSPLMDTRVSEITFLQCLHRIRAFRRAPHQPGCAPGRILVSLYTLPVVRLRFRMDMLSPQSGIPFSSFPADALNPPRIETLELRPWRPVDTYHRKFWGPRLGFSHMDLVSHGPTRLAVVYTLPPQHSNQCETKIYPPTTFLETEKRPP